MKILVNKKIVYYSNLSKVKKLIYRMLTLKVNKKYLAVLDKAFNINSFEIIINIISNITISRDPTYYVITFDRAKKYNGKPLSDWYNLITYGTLSVKGYPIFLEIADEISKHPVEVMKLYGY